jgi:signal transduction histidine kinase
MRSYLSRIGQYVRQFDAPTAGKEDNPRHPQMNLEAGFAVARAVVVLSVPLAIGQVQQPAGDLYMSSSTLAAIYSLYAAGVILAVVSLTRKPPGWVLGMIHAADIFWAFVFADRLQSMGPALLLMVFPLLTATLRWGPSATLATTLALVGLLQTSIEGRSIALDIQTAFVRFQTTASVILLGALFAHIGHRQRQALKAATSEALAPQLPTGSPAVVTEAIFDHAFGIFKPAHVQLIVEESNTGRTFLWQADRYGTSRSNVFSQEFDQSSADSYLTLVPEGDWQLLSGKNGPVLKQDKAKAASADARTTAEFARHFKTYSTVLSTVIEMGDEWRGRFIVCDPSVKRSQRSNLQSLKAFSTSVSSPILTSQVCLRACRDTAAEERARLARELHDGVIQSLLGVDLQLESLKRQSGNQNEKSEELRRVQDILRREAMGLRQMVNDSRRVALSPERLLEYLSDLLERFQRDSGIVTRFFADLDTDRMPPRICHEITRVTEECLVNTRKHSNASSLTVRLGSNPESWLLVVLDDGTGFNFRGEWPMEQLISSGLGPAVIMDRVQTLGGDLMIDSTPTGSRIEINIPKLRHSPKNIFSRDRGVHNRDLLTRQHTEAK